MAVDLHELARAVPMPEQVEATETPALGRLNELAAWVAAAQGQWPPVPFRRIRLVVFGTSASAAAASSRFVADLGGIGTTPVTVGVGADMEEAFAAGMAAADAEVDAGADLLLVGAVDDAPTFTGAAVVVAVLTGQD